MKFKNWDGKDLKGTYDFTIKIDGIRLHVDNGMYTSRSGKPLYNLTKGLSDGIYEIFTGEFKETIEIVRSNVNPIRNIALKEIYPLFPTISHKLYLSTIKNPTIKNINYLMAEIKKEGYEGLVLRHHETGNYIKVKTKYTHDSIITGYVEGKGRLKGKLGKFTTTMGDCGTGYSDKLREELWALKDELIGTYIEVECMELTPNGKFRHPRFVRLRPDK